MFWLAQKGDARAAAIILQALEKDPAADVRKKAVFALSQLKDDAGVTALIGLAKNATDAAVRSEAAIPGKENSVWLSIRPGAWRRKMAAAASTAIVATTNCTPLSGSLNAPSIRRQVRTTATNAASSRTENQIAVRR